METDETVRMRVAIELAEERASTLEEVAAWMREYPEAAARLWVHEFNIWARDRDDWDELIRKVGPFDKGATGGYLKAKVKAVPVVVNIAQSDVCEKVKVGEREVMKPVYPEGVEPEMVPDVEDVYEYRCPESWLS